MSSLTLDLAEIMFRGPENFIILGQPQARWIHNLSTWPQGVDDISSLKIFIIFKKLLPKKA